MSVRKPVVAGYFYESRKESLINQIKWAFTHKHGPGSIPEVSEVRSRESIGFVVPHAGYIYSGPVAAHSYAKLASEGKPDVFVLLGPNHVGAGEIVSVWDEGVWETPLGRAIVDAELAKEIISNSRYARPDKLAHYEEHSIEVQIPFLQYLFKDVSIVPISIMYQVPEISEDLAKSILKASSKLGRDLVVIASTDLTHYEPHDRAVEKDKTVLDKIKSLDPKGLFDVVLRRNISMCGVAPVMTLLYYAILKNSSGVEILKYATSGDISGDKSLVVGYSAIRILK
ncbi:MAG: AmmeMemoRadiSam system protein B [Desulfurococcaceae archaeon TW002]